MKERRRSHVVGSVKFKELFIDRRVAGFPETHRIREKVDAPISFVSDAKSVYNRILAAKDPVAAGKQVLFLTENKGPFIRDWLVCGPYRKAGAAGATTVFNLAFGPEKPGEAVKWSVAPAGDTVNLAGFFPNQSNCVAYLKTEIIAPEATDAILLMGSDDGIKAWLNGAVVHSNNVDRGQVVDQDMAPVKLKQGVNELLLKITQGGGGWSACARIVGPDGLPIEDLRVKSQAGAAP